MNLPTRQKQFGTPSSANPPRTLVLVTILVVFLILANIAIALTQPKDRINGEIWVVKRVVSGQTIEAELANNPNLPAERVRLLGISAPLKEQSPWGDRARQRLSELVKDQKVILEADAEQRDDFDRRLAYVWKDNVLINHALVLEGLAIADPYPANNKYDARISRAQSQARLQELGIWNTKNPLRLSPRDFRRQLSN